MQRSDITGRPIVPAASRRPWQLDERRVLVLLFHLWDLTQDQIRDIFHGIFPHRADYGTPKLRDQHNQRWSGGRRERDWRVLDRPNDYNGTPYTNQEHLDFASVVADIDREAANLNIVLTLQVAPTHEYLTSVPAGTAGIPAGAVAAQQAQAAPVAGPATAPPAIAAQTQAQARVIPGTARKAPVSTPVSNAVDADDQSDDDDNSTYHESESDVADADAEHESDDEYQSDDAANNEQDSGLDVVDFDENGESDRSTNNDDSEASIADAEQSEEELFLDEQDAGSSQHSSRASSPRDQTAAPMADNTRPYPWDQEEHYVGPPPADWPEDDVAPQRVRSTRWPTAIPQPSLGSAPPTDHEANNLTNNNGSGAMIAEEDDIYRDFFSREPDVRPPGPDVGSSFQEAERKAAQALNVPLSTPAPTQPTMAPHPIANCNPDYRNLDDLHGLKMLHHKDIKFCDFGAHLINTDEPVPVNPASQLYRLGGPLHLICSHWNSETKEFSGKQVVMICNTTWCGVCRSTDWAQAVQDPADPMTLLPEDSCMSHSDTILQDMLRRMRGRPTVHRGDMGKGDWKNIFCARIGEGARVTPYSVAVSKKEWTDERIVIITPEDVSAISVIRCGEGCDKC
ncbi:hypothetical protein CBER1_07194 [Cercospora berteroae]|uniref:Uncharacterized protein n=1 Tax=Cercospora berteroae TaxID=357750 RepID=A0A2S6BRW9_9PEZI|nr:hypothetical protein CBER1_07194 [Cercospora berteroae]